MAVSSTNQDRTDPTGAVLLTGATGYLGHEVLKRFLEDGRRPRILALVRPRGGGIREARERLAADLPAGLRDAFAARVTPVPGDVERPRLGLDPAAFAQLAAGVTAIVNSAAAVDFALPLPEARRTNVDGVRHLLELARAAGRLDRFLQVSTAHVAGRRSGLVLEDELEHDAGFVNAYEQSKHEAERILRDAMATLPVAICRTTTLIGDARTGRVRGFNFFHQAIRLMYGGHLRALPGEPDGHVDLIPVDWAAAGIHRLLEDAFRPGETVQLAATPARSFTLSGLVRATHDALTTSPHSRRRSLASPVIIPAAEFESMVRAEGGVFAAAAAALDHFLPHLSLPKVFDTANADREVTADHPAPPIDSYYGRVVDYCLRTAWGRKPTDTPLVEKA